MLILLLVLFLVFGGGGYFAYPGGAPGWYGPGFGGVIVLILIFLALTGRL